MKYRVRETSNAGLGSVSCTFAMSNMEDNHREGSSVVSARQGLGVAKPGSSLGGVSWACLLHGTPPNSSCLFQ